MSEASRTPTIAAPDPDAVAAAVRAHRLRLTSARRIVIEALFAAEEPVSAAEIAGGMDGRVPRSDVAAVYRNLEVLERIGVVRHVHRGHSEGRYALADRVETEYLHCESCGELRAVAPSVLRAAREAIRVATGWNARFSHFPIVGTCPSCSATPPDAGEWRRDGD